MSSRGLNWLFGIGLIALIGSAWWDYTNRTTEEPDYSRHNIAWYGYHKASVNERYHELMKPALSGEEAEENLKLLARWRVLRDQWKEIWDSGIPVDDATHERLYMKGWRIDHDQPQPDWKTINLAQDQIDQELAAQEHK